MGAIQNQNQAFAAGGQFLVGGSVIFGNENQRPDPNNPGTLKQVFTDVGLITPAMNPQPLNGDAKFQQGGSTGRLYGSGVYSYIVLDANGVERTYNPSFTVISALTAQQAAEAAEAAQAAAEAAATRAENAADGITVPAGTTLPINVDNVTELRTLSASVLMNGRVINLAGHTNVGVGGGPLVVRGNQTTETDNGYDVFVVAGKVLVREDNIARTQEQAGALVDGSNDDSTAIQTLINRGQLTLNRGVSALGSSLQIRQDHLINGQGKGFTGSVLIPSGNFPAIVPKVESPAIVYTRNTFSNFQIEARNITSDYAIKLDKSFLTNFKDIWIRNSYKGIEILNSDSVSFDNVMIMEDSDNDAILIGDNARSIKFYSCNFEKNPGNTNPGGVVRIQGTGPTVSSGDFYGCQLERSGLQVVKGSGKWIGGKATSSAITFYPQSRDCFLSADMYGSTQVHDFGMKTELQYIYCQNVSTAKHEIPLLMENTAGSLQFGQANDEVFYVVSAGTLGTTAQTSCQINITQDGSNVSSSPLFDLGAQGTSTGTQTKDSYTFITTVKNGSNPTSVSLQNCDIFGMRGGVNVLSNGTFPGGSVTGWNTTDCATSAATEGVMLTPSNSTWSFRQNISSILKTGSRYICYARYNGEADLCLGLAHDGRAGFRPLRSEGVSDVYGDGDVLAMLSFEYEDQSDWISIGSITSSSEVNLKWLCIIECQ
jgi:hypothetical protein